jgi:hypothetical protein
MRLLSLTLLAAALTAGCRPPGEAAPAPHAPYRGPLVSSLQVEAMGDSARMVLQVTNATSGPVSLTFPSGQSYDFQVLDAGRVVWTWSADRSFMQAVRMHTLAAGETTRYAEVWHAPAGMHGRPLTVRATLTSSDQPVEQTAEFRLP